jgi:hypothetical protein
MKISDVRLSFSSLKAFSKSPAHWVYYKKREFKQSPAMRRGWLTHLIALEPERQSELEIIDVATRANKQFKEAVELHGEDKVFTRKEFTEAGNLADRIKTHPLASKLIYRATEVEEHIEFSLDGVAFHGYADIVGEDYIADIKVTDPEPKKMQRWLLDNLYHMQLALYGYAKFNATADTKYFIIAVDPNPPYGVVVYEIDTAMIQDGMNRAKLEVSMFKDWYRGWDGESIPRSYDYYTALDRPMIMELPTWYK